MIAEFVTSINNEQKIRPALYLRPEQHNIEGKIILCIYVPVSSQVCWHGSKVFDRNGDADIDITLNTDLMCRLFANKSNTHFVNKVTDFGLEDLRADILNRARKMAVGRVANHSWGTLSDLELLRSVGLWGRKEGTNVYGVTVAGVLLFGKDETIVAVLPQHKTDAIFRYKNVDRYDDRDVIITNLFDTYDRLIAFAQKHLNDYFTMDGIVSVSARDKILREIFTNSLAHRDYASGYVAKFVIEETRMFTENANRAHGHGVLNLETFEPLSKNPSISRVLREVGLSDELGSGMKNTNKFTQIYSCFLPEFTEGNSFKIVIPLNEANVAVPGVKEVRVKVGADIQGVLQISDQVSGQVSDQVSDQVAEAKICLIQFCIKPRSAVEMMKLVNVQHRAYFRRRYLMPLLEEGKLTMTIPDKPKSRFQRYVVPAEVGREGRK